MELPQSCPFGAQGRKATHDFLSLYTHPSLQQQDPRPTSATTAAHGDFLKTHNFLQPLEREDKNGSKEEDAVDINTEKAPPPPDPQHFVEHSLPGGIGTYSINHISYYNPKPDIGNPVFMVARASSNDQINDDNSNCSSYTGSGFTLWDESAARKGNTGKENLADQNAVEETVARTQWPLDGPSESSSNHHSSRRSSSQPPIQKHQSFIEMIKSAKGTQAKEEHDEENFTNTKEGSSSHKGQLRVKIDGKGGDQKANTPRSKHSATEQRRRCKINDRFQTLRELIPYSDQKRDKASFLLEVIQYIQFLQEKVHKYEGSYPGWNSEAVKLSPWINNLRPTEGFVDQHRGANGEAGPALMFGTKLDEKNIVISPNVSGNSQTIVEVNNGPTFKAMGQQSRLTDKAASIATASQVDIFNPMRNGLAVAHPATKPTSDTEKTSLPQFQSWENRTYASESVAASDRLKEHELAVEGGTINISSSYSQGLLNTLTHALQSSGVDLTQASISVQVDVGKRANSGQSAPQMNYKDAEFRSSNKPIGRARVESNHGESDQVTKKLKTGKS